MGLQTPWLSSTFCPRLQDTFSPGQPDLQGPWRCAAGVTRPPRCLLAASFTKVKEQDYSSSGLAGCATPSNSRAAHTRGLTLPRYRDRMDGVKVEGWCVLSCSDGLDALRQTAPGVEQ